MDDAEEVFAADDGSNNSDSTNLWDRIIAALQGMLLDTGFEETHSSFCRQHCHEFEDGDENKLCYTQLFEAYCELLEGSIQRALQAAVPGLSMDEFAAMLGERQEQLGAEVFDLLLSMSDFATFKELMLETRRQQESSAERQQLLLSGITCSAAPLHTEEQEDGEQRPDLDFCTLSIAPLAPAALGGRPAGASAKTKAAQQPSRAGSSKQAGAAAAPVKRQSGRAFVV
ncbi:hypothetical protein OEZ86_003446 [Tetradesmus obliquus]|nr:hypothetical protein OEZ86_003446 [Tetradesmus obliquus]